MILKVRSPFDRLKQLSAENSLKMKQAGGLGGKMAQSLKNCGTGLVGIATLGMVDLNGVKYTRKEKQMIAVGSKKDIQQTVYDASKRQYNKDKKQIEHDEDGLKKFGSDYELEL